MIDLNKEYQTRCGFTVKLLEVRDNGIYGVYKQHPDEKGWMPYIWTLDGFGRTDRKEDAFDLLDVSVLRNRTIDPTKKYRTRSGSTVKIYSIDGGGDNPVHGAYQVTPGVWSIASWTANGFYSTDGEGSLLDLFEIPQVTGWINVDSDGTVKLFATRADADLDASNKRVACVEINCSHGQL